MECDHHRVHFRVFGEQRLGFVFQVFMSIIQFWVLRGDGPWLSVQGRCLRFDGRSLRVESLVLMFWSFGCRAYGVEFGVMFAGCMVSMSGSRCMFLSWLCRSWGLWCFVYCSWFVVEGLQFRV